MAVRTNARPLSSSASRLRHASGWAMGLLALAATPVCAPRVARASCSVAIVRPGNNAQLAVTVGSNYDFRSDGAPGDPYVWTVNPAGARTFQNGTGYTTGYTPVLPVAAVVTVTRTCQDHTTASASISVRQYQIVAAQYPKGGYTVGLGKYHEVMITVIGPDAGPVPIQFRSAPAPNGGTGIVRFSMGAQNFANPNLLSIPAGGTPVDVNFEGNVLSSHVNDIEIDHRVPIDFSPGHDQEGIGCSYLYTVAQADIDLEGVAEGSETGAGGAAGRAGGLLRRNNNDSNGNQVLDSNENNLGAADPDLKSLTVQQVMPVDITGTFRTEIKLATKTGVPVNSIHAWDMKDKSGAHASPANGETTFEDAVNGGLPKTRALEAQATGRGQIHGFLKDKGYRKDGLTPTVDDTIELQAAGGFGGRRPTDPPADDLPNEIHMTLWFGGPWTFMANRDDDDANGVRDYDQGGAMSVDDDELNEIIFSCFGAELLWKLTWPGSVRVWADKTRTTAVTSVNFTEYINEDGKSLFFETKTLSGALDDLTFTMTVKYPPTEQYPNGEEVSHDYKATTGCIIGPQYATQLGRYRYRAIFPATPRSGGDGLQISGGTLHSRRTNADAESATGDVAEIDWGETANPYLGTITFQYDGPNANQPRSLAWTVDVNKITITPGTQQDPALWAGNAPAAVVHPSSAHWLLWHGGGADGVHAMDYKIDFTCAGPRQGVSAGGPYLRIYLRIGCAQGYQDTTDESSYSLGTLWWDTKVNGTAGYAADTQDRVAPWNIITDFKLCSTGDGQHSQVLSFDLPGATRPVAMHHEAWPNGTWAGLMQNDPPQAGDSAAAGEGTLQSTTGTSDLKEWVAIWWNPTLLNGTDTRMLDVQADEDPVRDWNRRHVWCLAKAVWRSVISGTHDATYPCAFHADATNKNECHVNGSWQAWAPWDALHAVTAPDHTVWTDANNQYLPYQIPVHYVKR